MSGRSRRVDLVWTCQMKLEITIQTLTPLTQAPGITPVWCYWFGLLHPTACTRLLPPSFHQHSCPAQHSSPMCMGTQNWNTFSDDKGRVCLFHRIQPSRFWTDRLVRVVSETTRLVLSVWSWLKENAHAGRSTCCLQNSFLLSQTQPVLILLFPRDVICQANNGILKTTGK